MPLDPWRSRELPLPALAAAVNTVGAPLLAGVQDGRVAREVDERTLRYLQSLGLLDRPLRYDGRTAVYGFRHLLQALCVRALQARGYSLAQAQAALTGATDAELEGAALEALAAAPAAWGAPPPPRLGEVVSPPSAPPAPPPAPVAPPVAPAAPPPGAAPPAAQPWVAVEVVPGVLVLIDPARHSSPQSVLSTLEQALRPRSTP